MAARTRQALAPSRNSCIEPQGIRKEQGMNGSGTAVRESLDLRRATRDEIAEALAEIALAAGPAMMEVYAEDPTSRAKSDGSPVTEADERAEAIIRAGLEALAPETPIVAEEAVAAGGEMRVGEQFFLVDPLDGTREFLKRNGEFTVNVALIRMGAPYAGAVYAPALDRLWVGGEHAWTSLSHVGSGLPARQDRQRLSTRTALQKLTALASRSHRDPETEAFLSRLPIGDITAAGSSLKFCVVAEGNADVYPRFGPTMEWDTAAGDAVLRAAGGLVLCADGAEFKYGKADAGLKNGPFVAWGDPLAATLYDWTAR
jgi:3'(2'),5'-bisphosphate nucleotidase